MLTVPRADVRRKSELVRFRRALTLIGMTLVLPGSAQLMRGSKTVGRAALRVDGILAVGAIVAFATLGKEGLLKLGFKTWILAAAQVSLIVLGVCWLALFVDAWRLGRPPTMYRKHRLVSLGVSLTLMTGVATPLAYGAHLLKIQQGVLTDVFVNGGIGDLYKGRLNILLLGGDGNLERTGIRTDSITLASVDVFTGRTVLFSLPRNMEHVQFPPDTALAKQFPNGFPDFLYGVYTWGAENPKPAGGGSDPGAAAIGQAVAQTLGIPVHYYALVNLKGFQKVVDALGGITLRVKNRLPIGGGHSLTGAALPVLGYIEPGLQKLDGYHALWYARSRANNSDYDRMARQKCVLGAILREADPLTVLKNYEALASSAKHVLQTDLTIDALQRLVEVSAKTKNTKVTSVSFNPPLVNPADPDVVAIRERVAAAIAKSEAPVVKPSASPSPTPTSTAQMTAKQKKAAEKKAKKAAKKAAEKAAEAIAAAKAGGEPLALEDTCAYE